MIPTTIKPMLAAPIKGKNTFEDLKHKLPLAIQPKMDGIRCIIIDGKPYTRTLKDIPNRFIREDLTNPLLNGLDGELVVGPPGVRDAYRRTMSGVMSEAGEPDYTFHVFDSYLPPGDTFYDRYHKAIERAEETGWDRIECVETITCKTLYEVDEHECNFLDLGFEGAILRDPKGLYKFGRATFNQGQLIKLKRFIDSEALVIGYEEKMHNDNPAETDNLGHTKRSSHKANKTPAGTLGALVCETAEGIKFSIGTGMDDSLRKELWEKREHLAGMFVKFKYFGGGIKVAPRFPVFIGFRDPSDFGEVVKND